MQFLNQVKKLTLSPLFQAGLLLVICMVATLQAVGQDEIANFIIFKTAAQRFLHHGDLYDFIEYGIIWDKFLYAPSFTILFLPFTLLPDGVSVFLWLVTGAALFYYALCKLPLSKEQKAIVFFIALIDLVNSLQNLQTNALNTAFMLLIFTSLHNNKPAMAGLFTALALSIKIYPAASALLFLFYPGKLKFLLYASLFTAIIFALPLLVVEPAYYFLCLQNWYKTLAADTDILAIWKSPSLIGINYTWFPQTLNHFYIQLGGLLLVFLPLIKLVKGADLIFILKYLALIMIFVVIFNHAAESPTYVIAITGAALWYAVSEKSALNNFLLILLFVGCILLPTDIFPHWLRKEYLAPLKLRVIPCTIIWVKILFELLRYKPTQTAVA